MIREYDNFIIYYNDVDKEYIDSFIEYILSYEKDILSFFKLKKLNKKLKIKFWDNLDSYRDYRNRLLKKYYNRDVYDWEIASTSSNGVDILSFCESLKCRGHKKDKLDDYIKIGAHEFVHACHYEYNNNLDIDIWLKEGLACYLSNQYDKDLLNLDCSLSNILSGNVSYVYYYSLVYYLFNNKDNNYILNLLNKKDYLNNEINNIYKDAKKYIEKNKKS